MIIEASIIKETILNNTAFVAIITMFLFSKFLGSDITEDIIKAYTKFDIQAILYVVVLYIIAYIATSFILILIL